MTKVEFLKKHAGRWKGNKALKVTCYALFYSASAARARRIYIAAKEARL